MTNLPRVSDLVFAVFDRPIHPEVLSGLRSNRYKSSKLAVHIHLTSLGHMIVFCAENGVITELVSPRLCEFSYDDAIKCSSMEEQTELMFSHSGVLKYKTLLRTTQLKPLDYLRKANAVIMRQSKGRTIQYKAAGTGEPLSFSIADTRMVNNGVLVEVNHFFGACSSIMTTFSTIEKSNDNG